MRFRKNIICSVLIGFVAIAAIFCCCLKTAQASVSQSSAHSCCPAKADSTHDQQCPHQFVKGEKASLVSYEPHYLGKTAAASVLPDQIFVLDPLSQVSLAVDDGPPSVTEVPLYLQSHKLRL